MPAREGLGHVSVHSQGLVVLKTGFVHDELAEDGSASSERSAKAHRDYGWDHFLKPINPLFSKAHLIWAI